MAIFFFDTCAINDILDQGVAGKDLKKLLTQINRVAAIGRNTHFELSSSYGNRRKDLLRFIIELQPWYTCTREQLYKIELEKLRTGQIFDPWCSRAEKQLIEREAECLILGGSSQTLNQYIQLRNKQLDNLKKIYSSDRQSHDYKSLEIHSFEERLSKTPRNEETARELRKIFSIFDPAIQVSDILNFFKDESQYRALRTLFYTILYLDYSAQTTKQSPSKDRFTDAIQLTEASYCVTFVSSEDKLVKLKGSYGQKLNPDIELLRTDQFLEVLSSCSVIE